MPLGPLPGLQRLASGIFASNGTSIGPISFPACKLLVIYHVIVGYTGGDIAMFQFNSDTTAGNYGSWYASMSHGGTPALSQSASNAGTVAGIPVSGTTQTIGRIGDMTIINIAATRKTVSIRNANETTSSTLGAIDNGLGEWLNTSAQITSVTMKLVGSNSLLAGSGFIVYGDNF